MGEFEEGKEQLEGREIRCQALAMILERIHRRFSRAGLGSPWVPPEFSERVRKVHRWWFSTLEEKAAPWPYFYREYVSLLSSDSLEDFFTLAHAGHGTNSYAISYYLKWGRVRLLLQLAWGGAYMESDTTDHVRELLEIVANASPSIVAAAQSSGPVWEFMHSEFWTGGRLPPERLADALESLGNLE